jgi:GTPase SAR1 family protein
VGKTLLYIRFCDETFIESYLSTIEVGFRFRMFQVDDTICKLKIRDTVGQERYGHKKYILSMYSIENKRIEVNMSWQDLDEPIL